MFRTQLTFKHVNEGQAEAHLILLSTHSLWQGAVASEIFFFFVEINFSS